MEAPDRPAPGVGWLAVAVVGALLSLGLIARVNVAQVTARTAGPDFDCGSAMTNVRNDRPASTEGADELLLRQCRLISRRRLVLEGAVAVTAALIAIGTTVFVLRRPRPPLQ